MTKTTGDDRKRLRKLKGEFRGKRALRAMENESVKRRKKSKKKK